MLISAAVSAGGARGPWADPPRPPSAGTGPLEPPRAPSGLPSLEHRIPPAERATGDRNDLVIALVDGPGLSPSEEVCVDALLRHLKDLWRVVSPYPPRSVRFRRLLLGPDLATEPARALAGAVVQADLIWLQIGRDSPLVGAPLKTFRTPDEPDRGVLALLRSGMLILRPDPTKSLLPLDGVVLRGAR